MSRIRSTRRRFIRQAVGASAGALAFPYFVPATSLGGNGRTAPSERIVMGCIGVGGQGTHNMRRFMELGAQVVAVCDVETSSNLYYGGGTFGREPAREIVDKFYAEKKAGEYKGCEVYKDFRELLKRPDIDAVSIGTPDHWHGLICVAAAEAGKDIYCEKPLVNSVAEGRAVCEAVRRNRRVLQTGSHERSGDNSRFACELVRNGRIGRLHTIEINLPCSDPHHKDVMSQTGPQPEVPVPEGLDYDFWLGPVPKAPYTPRRVHFWWRFILACGGGEMTDRGAHIIDLAQLGNGSDDTGPVTFQARGTRPASGIYDTFFNYEFENVYANGVRMIGSSREPRGLKFIGTDGWIFIHIHGAKLEAEPASLLEEKIDDHELRLGRSPGHHQNFLDCVRSRRQPVAHAEIGHRTATICHLNNIAMLTGRKLVWDPTAERITNDPEADTMLSRPMRPPWKL